MEKKLVHFGLHINGGISLAEGTQCFLLGEQESDPTITLDLNHVTCGKCIKSLIGRLQDRFKENYCPDGNQHLYHKPVLEWIDKPIKTPAEEIINEGEWKDNIECVNCHHKKNVLGWKIARSTFRGCKYSKDKNHNWEITEDDGYHHEACTICKTQISIPLERWKEIQEKKKNEQQQ